MSHGKLSKLMVKESYKIPKKTALAIMVEYKKYSTMYRLSGSGECFKLTPEMLRVIEEQKVS